MKVSSELLASVQSLVAVLQQQIHSSSHQDPADTQEAAGAQQTQPTHHLLKSSVRKYFTYGWHWKWKPCKKNLRISFVATDISISPWSFKNWVTTIKNVHVIITNVKKNLTSLQGLWCFAWWYLMMCHCASESFDSLQHLSILKMKEKTSFAIVYWLLEGQGQLCSGGAESPAGSERAAAADDEGRRKGAPLYQTAELPTAKQGALTHLHSTGHFKAKHESQLLQ